MNRQWIYWIAGTIGVFALFAFANRYFDLKAPQTTTTVVQNSNAPYSGSPVSGITTPSTLLTDQHGHFYRLTDFQGKVVVLSFLDTHCKTICPITAQELVQAYTSLGPAADNVVFLGVNVNLKYNRIYDVQQFSATHGLDKIPDWHFLTGDTKKLKSVWRAFYISANQVPSADVTHTSVIYILNQSGLARWIISNADTSTSPVEYSSMITQHVLQVVH